MCKPNYAGFETVLKLRAASPKVARDRIRRGSVSCLFSRSHRRRRHRRVGEGETFRLMLPAVPLRVPAGQIHM